MEEEVERLRLEIERVPRGLDGRRVYDDVIRNNVVDVAKKWRSKGHTLKELANALTLNPNLLMRWTKKFGRSKRVSKLREVRVDRQNEVSEEQPWVGPVVVFPSGVKVVGLTMSDVVALAKELR